MRPLSREPEEVRRACGFDCTIGADGWPTDPNHPVYRAEKLLGSAEKQPAPGKRDAPLGPSVPSE